MTAGRMIWISSILIRTMVPDSAGTIVCQVMICPTSPAVPIPDPVALLVILKIMVPTGPKMALERMAGSQITGLRTILGT